MAGRCLRLSSRQLDALLTSLMLPVMLMLMFVYLFGGAVHTGTRYVTYVVPGVLMVCAGFGAATTAVSVTQDMTGGVPSRERGLGIPCLADPARQHEGTLARERGPRRPLVCRA